MAYNPFNIFRRNQKAIFAVITVFIMFTFVLSSGLGGGADFFDWLPRWLGAKSKKGDVVVMTGVDKLQEGSKVKVSFEDEQGKTTGQSPGSHQRPSRGQGRGAGE